MSICSLVLSCWKRVFAMTNSFSWQISVSLCPATFCTPRPNLPVTPRISWLPTFAFQSPIMKRASVFFLFVFFFLVFLLEVLVGLPKLKEKKVKSFSHVWLFTTPWTVAHQVPLSMGFSRQEYWRMLKFPSPGDLPNPGIEPRSTAMQIDALPS